MGYNIKQKIEICLKAESSPDMTQADLALWAKKQYGSEKPPSQTTISRILSAKNDLVASKESDFSLVRRRKLSNSLLRKILTEWITQATWENIPVTTPIIQLTANAIWNRLPNKDKDGNGMFNQKWCNHFVKRLNINLTGTPADIEANLGYKLNKVWKLDEKLELKQYLHDLIKQENYQPADIFTIDEFKLFHSLPLDQIFDVSSIDKGLKQTNFSSDNSLTVMLGCNIDGLEKLFPFIVGQNEDFDVSKSSHSNLKNVSSNSTPRNTIMNKVTESYQLYYQSNVNKWITSSMFQNYLLTLDHKLSNAATPRKILIILDDSSSHRLINVKFNNIKLCYLKNNDNHKNPYNVSYDGVKFDYLPMTFGIVEEFKILYRLQQYLEMINIQQNNSEDSTKVSQPNLLNNNKDKTRAPGINDTVLSETDYQVPLIRVIEWIKRAWDSIVPEKIFLSWKRTHLINFNQWPASDPVTVSLAHQSLLPIMSNSNNYNPQKGYEKLKEIMNYLNVVMPWEIDDLLGIVNERGKITLSYASIEEIIGSCLLEDQVLDRNVADSDNSDKSDDPRQAFNANANANWFANQENSAKILFNPLASPTMTSSSTSTTTSIPQQEVISDAMQLPDFTNTNTLGNLLPAVESRKGDVLFPLDTPFTKQPVEQLTKHHLEDYDENAKKRYHASPTLPSNLNFPYVSTPSLNDSLPSTASSPSYYKGRASTPLNQGLLSKAVLTYKSRSSANLSARSSEYSQHDTALPVRPRARSEDFELAGVLSKVIENAESMSDAKLSLSAEALNELRLNLANLQQQFQ